jgi:uncharacterized protein YjiS (DUF1127 family)
MEQVMHNRDEFYFLRFEHRPLTAEQLDRLQREVVRNATIDRARAVRRSLGTIARSFRRLGATALNIMRGWWAGFTDWNVRRAAVKELRGLDDRTLKDLGLHRSEIESVVHGPVAGVKAGGKVATVLFHMPYRSRADAVTPRGAQKTALPDTVDRAEAA